MGYFTKLIDRIWDEKGHNGRYTIKQMLSILVLMTAISGIYYMGMGVWTLVKGFLADG